MDGAARVAMSCANRRAGAIIAHQRAHANIMREGRDAALPREKGAAVQIQSDAKTDSVCGGGRREREREKKKPYHKKNRCMMYDVGLAET